MTGSPPDKLTVHTHSASADAALPPPPALSGADFGRSNCETPEHQIRHGLTYQPEVDGLRALSIAMVIYTHYLPEKYWPLGIYWGSLGVKCFFVISGYLITSILISERNSGTHFLEATKKFFVRRAIRLYPALLVVLSCGFIFNLYPVRQTIFWHLSYLSNFYFVRLGAWNGGVSHLWSLAVEAQFYLFWPLLILLCPPRSLPPLLVGTALIAPVFRAVWRSSGGNDIGAAVLAPASFDALAIGALVALFIARPHARLISAGLGIFGLSVFSLARAGFLPNLAGAEIDLSGIALFFGCMICYVLTTRDSWLAALLSCRPLVQLGLISYGAYLVHPLVREAWPGGDDVSLTRAAAWTCATLILAYVLRLAVERPLIDMGKRRFLRRM
jgi:peptidoglycan/LPS O-acetylase OafA/YrhL